MKTLKGVGMVVKFQQSNFRIALAYSAPKIVAETLKEAAFRCCDQRRGMFMHNGSCALSGNEKIWSASGAFEDILGKPSNT